MNLTDEDITRILKLIDASQFEEISIEWNGLSLLLRRGDAADGAAPANAATQRLVEAGSLPATRALSHSPEATSPAKSEQKPPIHLGEELPPDGLEAVRAPTMGTFYRSPEPGASPFVQEGGTVADGDPLCLIEVMKVFNAVCATGQGQIEKICVEDGALVDFDQMLFHFKRHDN